jgi:hypothetical protein
MQSIVDADSAANFYFLKAPFLLFPWAVN